MSENLTRKLLRSHRVGGELHPGTDVALKVDQTLTQDATGTLVMLALEAMELDRVKTDVSVQYVDHNLIQSDHRNPDDHLFLESACRRYGVWFSRAGNGVSHPLHMKYFGRPGAVLAGSDSHTPAAGGLGMLGFGAGGLDVAMAMAGHPLTLTMPRVWGVRLEGLLPAWVSAKDIVLEMLRRHGVRGGLGFVLEFYGAGVEQLSVMDRHVIANMGTELGATSTVFPSDESTRNFMRRYCREEAWQALAADPDAEYDRHEKIDLSALEPLIAKPSSPGNVVPVTEVAGETIYQAYIGSSANPGYRDLAMAARMVRGRQVAPGVSFDINPASRDTLETLSRNGLLADLIHAGARLHQAGCNGCIGMGQAPATGRNSLRTVPRNFAGRSGTQEDSVFLCSPETATASALLGRIADPRKLSIKYPALVIPDEPVTIPEMFEPPLSPEESRGVDLIKGPNIRSMPKFEPLPDVLDLPVLLCIGDDISTDEILPAGARILPYRSNIPEISRFVFNQIDASYAVRARETQAADGHAVVGGENYGQGSSREHAALAPRYLGLRLVIALSFARIHLQNLVNYGVLPLLFKHPGDKDIFEKGTELRLSGLKKSLREGDDFEVALDTDSVLHLSCSLSRRQRDIILAGGLVNWMSQRLSG